MPMHIIHLPTLNNVVGSHLYDWFFELSARDDGMLCALRYRPDHPLRQLLQPILFFVHDGDKDPRNDALLISPYLWSVFLR